ncbi:lysophospholipid acyltransferase family protein [soil metagenome]
MQEITSSAKQEPTPTISKLILGRFLAFWALIIFVATLFIIVIPILLTFLIPEPGGVKTFKAISKAWMTVFLYGIGCSIKVVGKKNYDPSKNYVVTSNHSSLMDVPLLTPFFPGPNKTIAKKSFSKVPLFGWVYSRGSVLVDRTSDRSRKKSYDDMKHVLLKENLNMVLYPEGTRNRTGLPLKSFYDGAFKLAADSQKDIIPVVMYNTAKALPPSLSFFVWPCPLEMHLLPPVSVSGKTGAELKEIVFIQMWEYIEAGKR